MLALDNNDALFIENRLIAVKFIQMLGNTDGSEVVRSRLKQVKRTKESYKNLCSNAANVLVKMLEVNSEGVAVKSAEENQL